MVRRLQDAFNAADAAGQAAVRSVFEAAGLDPLLDVRPRRWVMRQNNR
jgi:hypothetical protein